MCDRAVRRKMNEYIRATVKLILYPALLSSGKYSYQRYDETTLYTTPQKPPKARVLFASILYVKLHTKMGRKMEKKSYSVALKISRQRRFFVGAVSASTYVCYLLALKCFFFSVFVWSFSLRFHLDARNESTVAARLFILPAFCSTRIAQYHIAKENFSN